jgi:hypothetical protein
MAAETLEAMPTDRDDGVPVSLQLCAGPVRTFFQAKDEAQG